MPRICHIAALCESDIADLWALLVVQQVLEEEVAFKTVGMEGATSTLCLGSEKDLLG